MTRRMVANGIKVLGVAIAATATAWFGRAPSWSNPPTEAWCQTVEYQEVPGNVLKCSAGANGHSLSDAVLLLGTNDRGPEDCGRYRFHVFDDGCFYLEHLTLGPFGSRSGSMPKAVVAGVLRDARVFRFAEFAEDLSIEGAWCHFDFSVTLDGKKKSVRFFRLLSGDFYEVAADRGDEFLGQLVVTHLLSQRLSDWLVLTE